MQGRHGQTTLSTQWKLILALNHVLNKHVNHHKKAQNTQLFLKTERLNPASMQKELARGNYQMIKLLKE